MKNFFYLLFLLFFIYSCDDNMNEIVATGSPGQGSPDLSELARTNLQSTESQEAYIDQQLASLNLSESETQKLAKDKSDNALLGNQGKALNNLGNQFYALGNVDLALVYYLNSLQLKLLLSNKESRAITYRNLGLAYQAKGDYQNAAINFWQSLLIAEETGNEVRTAMLYNDLGIIYDLAHDFVALESFDPETSASLSYYQHALAINQSLGNDQGISHVQFNIGLLFRNGKSNSAARTDLEYEQEDVEDEL